MLSVIRSAQCSNHCPATIENQTLLHVLPHGVATACPNLAGAAGARAREWSGHQIVHATAYCNPGHQDGCASKAGEVVDLKLGWCSRGWRTL